MSLLNHNHFWITQAKSCIKGTFVKAFSLGGFLDIWRFDLAFQKWFVSFSNKYDHKTNLKI